MKQTNLFFIAFHNITVEKNNFFFKEKWITSGAVYNRKINVVYTFLIE